MQTRHVFRICSLYSDKHFLYCQANIKDNRNLPKWWTVVLGDMLLQSSNWDALLQELFRSLQAPPTSTMTSFSYGRLGMTLMKVQEVLESIGQLLVLANGPNNHNAGISVVTLARATHESQVLLPMKINTEAREAMSQKHCDPGDHSQSSNFCIM